MNIADDHKPFSHRVPPLLHLDCPVAATASADDRTDVSLRAGVAAYEPMISWFCGQFDGRSRGSVVRTGRRSDLTEIRQWRCPRRRVERADALSIKENKCCDARIRTLLKGTCSVKTLRPVSYTHLRAHETDSYLVCRLLLEKKKKEEKKVENYTI